MDFPKDSKLLANSAVQLVLGEGHTELQAQIARQIDAENLSSFDAIMRVFLSNAGLDGAVEHAATNHLYHIHNARRLSVRTCLPQADIILDLGGANAPLFSMGYPHKFEKLYLIDLPADERHEFFAKAEMEVEVDNSTSEGDVSILYCDMTKLSAFDDGTIDLVWSGQSIEHVPEEAAVRMAEEAFRVLRPGGVFALDTPNGSITSVHAASAGLEVVHPEHFKEYSFSAMVDMLSSSGFAVENTFGTNHMPETVRTGVFDYRDFVVGARIHPLPEECYSQFHVCRKPG
ncbi:MAG: class I SAM-dependent methyltransferase [Henriciella sp.]|uniref:methyltransferase domain-containing protein n=1 Tax=Henriciella sp. TaxID=1968823 RepID=UPI003C79578C